MSSLAPDEVAINARFRLSLQTVGIPVSFPERDFAGETGYLLRVAD
jgi:hypothetical protein